MEYVLLTAGIIAQVGLGSRILWQDTRSRIHRLFAFFMLVNAAASFVGLLRLVPADRLVTSRLMVADAAVVFIWNATFMVIGIVTIFYQVQVTRQTFWPFYFPFGVATLATAVVLILYRSLPDQAAAVVSVSRPGVYEFDQQVFPVTIWMIVYQAICIVVSLALLANVVVRRRTFERRPALLTGCALFVLSLVNLLAGAGLSGRWQALVPSLSGMLLSLIIGFIVWRYRLFSVPIAALNLAWDHLREGVIILRTDRFVLNCNQSAARLLNLSKEFVENKSIDTVLRFSVLPRQAWLNLWDVLQKGQPVISEVEYVLEGAKQRVRSNALPIFDNLRQVQGYMWLLDDVTAQHRSEQEIQARNAELQGALHELQATSRAQGELLETIRTLSAPAVPVLQGIIVLPLSGQISSDRAALIMDNLLDGIRDYEARVAIIDITGVPSVDTSVANHLIQAARAATLMGCHPILVGIRPEIAQVLVELGVNLGELGTFSDLRSGVEYALHRLGFELAEV